MNVQLDVVTGLRWTRPMRLVPPLAALLVTLFVAGCGGDRTASIEERRTINAAILRKLFGTEEEVAQLKPALKPTGEPLVCPVVEIRQEGAYHEIYLPNQPVEPANLRYQAAFSKTARECDFRADYIALKYGFAGRVIVGPAGTSGEVTLPIRVELATKSDRLAWGKSFKLNVNIPQGAGSQFFSHTGDDMVYQLRYGEKISDLRIYIGFDTGETWAKPSASDQ